MKMKQLICSALIVGGLTATSHAASILWAANTITDENDISFDGTLVEAVNAAGTGGSDVTVTVGGNSILFVENNDIGTNNNNGDFFAYDTGNSGYNDILGILDFGPNGQPSATYQFTGLTSGQDYQVQFWYGDDGGGTAGRTMTLTGVVDTELVSGTYATGTFTADAATQDMTWTASANGIRVNAFQLRAVPEPSSVALLGLGAAGLMIRRRR